MATSKNTKAKAKAKNYGKARQIIAAKSLERAKHETVLEYLGAKTPNYIRLRKEAPKGANVLAGQTLDYGTITERFIQFQDVNPNSQSTYRRALRPFFGWCTTRAISLDTVQLSDLIDYKETLLQAGYSPLSIGLYLTVVRRFFAWCESLKIYPNIAQGLKSPHKAQTHKKQHLTNDQVWQLWEACSTRVTAARDYAIISLMLYGGLRCIEVTRANIGDITTHRGKRVLKIWGKGRAAKDEYIVLTDNCYNAISEYLNSERKGAKAGEPLFTSTSNRNQRGRLTVKTVSHTVKYLLRTIGIDDPHYTAHSLRHTTAVAILKAGGTTEDVQTVLRHRSLTTSQIYTESIKEELRLEKAPENLVTF